MNSVTVAGRDGAGRLGQESEKLTISINPNPQVVVGYRIQQNSVIVQWKVSNKHIKKYTVL